MRKFKIVLKNISIFSVALFFCSFSSNSKSVNDAQQKKNDSIPLYKNAKTPIDLRVQDLLKRMTLEEKVYQMCAVYPSGKGDETIITENGDFSVEYYRKNMVPNGVGFVSIPSHKAEAKKGAELANAIQKVSFEESRLGIPTIIYDEGLHGLMTKGACSYPQAMALAATWDDSLVQKISTAIGKEAFSRGSRQLLSSTFDIGRDPREGRVEETYGEDPYLVSKMAVAYVSGVQSNGVLATGKHFVANFVGDGGRDGGAIQFSERLLREVYFRPYEAAIKEANLMGIMAAYNSLNGIPCSSNKWLLTDILRNEWGFKGIVVSDWSGLPLLNVAHRVAENYNQAAVLGVKAGLDVDLPRWKVYKLLVEEVKAGRVDIELVNASVSRILEVKFRIGLFEHPYVTIENAVKLQDAPEHKELALEAARKCMVLLKNEKNILPLLSTYKTIAVVGPNANAVQLGGYTAPDAKAITPLQGIVEAFPKATIRFAKGCGNMDNSNTGFDEALKIAQSSDAIILVMGGTNPSTGGEQKDRMDLRLMGQQENLIKVMIKLKKPLVVVLVNGGPIIIKDWIDNVDGVLMAWYSGEEGGKAIGEILSGKCNPSGKLPITFPLDNGQIPIYYGSRPYGRDGIVVEIPKPQQMDRYFPQFPFGFGLSYTKFDYTNIRCSNEIVENGKSVDVLVDIQNIGSMDGDEIMQLYLSDTFCRITRPVKELINFKRISLKAGEKRTVKFTVTPKDLSFLNEDLKPEVEPGEFVIMAGKNSVEGITAKFNIK